MKSFMKTMSEINFTSKILLMIGFVIFVCCELLLVAISLLVVKLIRRKDTWIYLPAKFYKLTWLKYISFIVNWNYKRRYKVFYKKYSYELEERLLQIQQSIILDKDTILAITEIIDEFTYNSDPIFGLFDWVGEPAVQYMRMKLNILDHSFDCDDYAEFFAYCVKRLCYYNTVQIVSVVSKKPFIKKSHTFFIRDILNNIEVYSPYEKIKTFDIDEYDFTEELVKAITNYYNNKTEYYNIVI